MATVRICTTGGGGCIWCKKNTARKVRSKIENLEKAGKTFYCCGNQCVRIENISTITEEESKTPPETDDDDHCRDITIVRPNRMIINY